jgi:hypothetical protein
MSNDISPARIERTDINANPVGRKTFIGQLDRAYEVMDMLDQGKRSTKAIMERLGCARDTAVKARNDALALMAEERKPMNRTAMRNMEIGRIEGWIERLTDRANDLEWPTDPTSKEYKIVFDMFDKIAQRIVQYGEQLHRITGLNTEVQVNVDEKRRMIFVRQLGPDPSSSHQSSPSHDVVDGEVIENRS